MASEVIGGELDVADSKLLRGGMQSGLQCGKTVVLEHVQERGLASIVETKEEELCVLVSCETVTRVQTQ